MKFEACKADKSILIRFDQTLSKEDLIQFLNNVPGSCQARLQDPEILLYFDQKVDLDIAWIAISRLKRGGFSCKKV